MAWQSPGALVGVILVILFGAFFALAEVAEMPAANPLGGAGFMLLPCCGVIVVLVIVIAVAALQGSSRPGIPPPPPIQQPMVPAGQVGPVALNCPNCGAPPQTVDRCGVATCGYCNTRFLVR